jgi:hypothetical protein
MSYGTVILYILVDVSKKLTAFIFGIEGLNPSFSHFLFRRSCWHEPGFIHTSVHRDSDWIIFGIPPV